VVVLAFLIDSLGIETCQRRTTWPARYSLQPENGAYVAIGLYLAMVLLVSLGARGVAGA
jgi:hypothetical protein